MPLSCLPAPSCRPYGAAAALAMIGLLLAPSASLAITVGQLDHFGLSREDWGNNGATWSYQESGGAGGIADGYVDVSTSGNFSGAGSRVILDGSSDWQGDYLAAGVTQISMDVNNFSEGDMMLRLGFRAGGDNTVFVTNDVLLPAMSGWTGVVFDLAESNMETTGVSYTDTFSAVSRMRLIHRVDPNVSSGGPADAGDPVTGPTGGLVAARLGIDNVRALGVPEPSTLAMLAAGLAVAARRRKA